MFKHVLIPLDGSPLAEKAIGPAQQIVEPGGKITLLTVLPEHVFLIPPLAASDGTPASTTSNVVINPKNYLVLVAAGLVQNGFEADIDLLEGDPSEVILEVAAQRKIDAIAMCTHGYSGLERLMFGSVTTKVLNHAPCPVLVVPGRV